LTPIAESSASRKKKLARSEKKVKEFARDQSFKTGEEGRGQDTVRRLKKYQKVNELAGGRSILSSAGPSVKPKGAALIRPILPFSAARRKLTTWKKELGGEKEKRDEKSPRVQSDIRETGKGK